MKVRWQVRTLPTVRQQIGSAIGLAGLFVIASTLGGSVTVIGFALTMAAALSWAIGNVLMKRAGQVDMLAMVAWLSLVPPIPLFILSLFIEGPAAISAALSRFDLAATGAILYLAIPATLIAFAIWGKPLKLYPAAIVAPFSLLVPLFGIVSAWLTFGEAMGPARVAGMALIALGLMALSIPYQAKRTHLST